MAIKTLLDPVPFTEAFDWARKRKVVPTTLGHAELRSLRLELERRALILARVADARILSAVHERVAEIARGTQEAPGEGMDYATFRVEMQEVLDSVDYRPEPGREGTISDLRTPSRLNLVVETEQTLAAGRAHRESDLDPDVTDAFPAWELYRAQETKEKRDWEDRWRSAARMSGDATAAAVLAEHGRMVARKDSKIWKALGNAALFPDALDTDHPPFAFQSGMDVENVDRLDAIELGVIRAGDVVRGEPAQPMDLELSIDGVLPSFRDVLEEA